MERKLVLEKYILILLSDDQFSIKLIDLQSRIKALNFTKINEPDDLLVNAIILKFFHDFLGISVDSNHSNKAFLL